MIDISWKCKSLHNMTSFLGYGFIISWFGCISTSDTKGSYLWSESVTKLP
ncbi:hypothetical protein I3500192B8_11360 [Acidaminococcus intestini]